MALDLLPKSMFEAIDLLPDALTPVTFLHVTLKRAGRWARLGRI